MVGLVRASIATPAPAHRPAPAHAAAPAVAGRHDEHTMDALALRADDGRGTAPICCAEPQAGCEAQISEWGNPLTS